MPSKLKTVRVILSIYGGVTLAIGLLLIFGFSFFTGFSTFAERSHNFVLGVLLGSMGLVAGLVATIVSIIFFVAANGLRDKKPWSRVLSIVLSVLMLPSFPIGTVLGIVTLVCLLDDESTHWLEGKSQQ